MRWLGRGFRRAEKSRAILLAITAITVFGAVLVIPVDGGASGLADRIAHRIARAAAPRSAADGDARNAQPFGGVATVGALFMMRGGTLGQHFCTASVVDSPAGDLAVTAAHCVSGDDSGTRGGGQLVFIPGYANGARPYGTWPVSRVYTDAAWQSSQDPDDDVAFLKVAGASDGVPVEDVTGADLLGTAPAGGATVSVTGYPDGAAEPVSCVSWARRYSPTQLEFDCGGYTDGTSGSPFVADVSGGTREGTIVGVIGGYEQGGDTPSVSYSVAFGPEVTSLFRTAEAGG
jgi:V8-like Glu-specific endopeptidase